MKSVSLFLLTSLFLASSAHAQDLSALIPGDSQMDTIALVLGSIGAINALSVALEKIASLTPTDADDKVVAKITGVVGMLSKFVNFFIGKR